VAKKYRMIARARNVQARLVGIVSLTPGNRHRGQDAIYDRTGSLRGPFGGKQPMARHPGCYGLILSGVTNWRGVSSGIACEACCNDAPPLGPTPGGIVGMTPGNDQQRDHNTPGITPTVFQ
jgi:hypothetical protein